MTLFQKNINPKKLNLEEIWSVYKLVDKSLGNDLNYSFLDGVSKIIKKSSSIRFSSVLYTLGIKPEKNGMKNVTLLIRGLRINNFFDFVKFIRKLNV
jgi:hypothetical protein